MKYFFGSYLQISERRTYRIDISGESDLKSLTCEVSMIKSIGLCCRIENQYLDNVEAIKFVLNEESNQTMKMVEFVSSPMILAYSEIFTIYPNLTVFVLKQNSLEEWKRGYLKGAKRLEYLWISDNPITHLEMEAFAEAPNLIGIMIVNTPIKQISSTAFNGLDKLRVLFFRTNELGPTVNADIFDSIADTLTSLELETNKLKEFSEGFFQKFEKLTVLSLIENEFHELHAATFPKSLKKIFVGELKIGKN